MIEEEHVPPVRQGEIIEVRPNGTAAGGDIFVNYHGFIIFIKRIPKGKEYEQMMIKVTAVKTRFGFAEYRSS